MISLNSIPCISGRAIIMLCHHERFINFLPCKFGFLRLFDLYFVVATMLVFFRRFVQGNRIGFGIPTHLTPFDRVGHLLLGARGGILVDDLRRRNRRDIRIISSSSVRTTTIITTCFSILVCIVVPVVVVVELLQDSMESWIILTIFSKYLQFFFIRCSTTSRRTSLISITIIIILLIQLLLDTTSSSVFSFSVCRRGNCAVAPSGTTKSSARPPKCFAKNNSARPLKSIRFSGRAKPWPSSGYNTYSTGIFLLCIANAIWSASACFTRGSFAPCPINNGAVMASIWNNGEIFLLYSSSASTSPLQQHARKKRGGECKFYCFGANKNL